jgi:hypothetical protein
MKSTISSGLVLLIVVTACTPSSDPTHTVEWYLAHPAERADRLQQCRRNPGELSATPNCINAQRATTRTDAGKRGTLDVQPRADLKLGGK